MTTPNSASQAGSSSHGNVKGNVNAKANTKASGMIASIIAVGKQYLCDAGPTAKAAAVCLARLLTRLDMEDSHLTDFMEWASAVIIDSQSSDVTGREEREPPRLQQ